MKNFIFFSILLFVSFTASAQAKKNKPVLQKETSATTEKAKKDYLYYVRTFADTLLAHGTDKYGTKHLPMWAGLIDTRDYSVPKGTLEEAERTKSGDKYTDQNHRRSVGGANLYHDFETIQTFEVLSVITGDPKYEKAAKDYIAAFLTHTQNDYTGLLGWGGQLYYDFYKDSVSVLVKNPDWTHSLLKQTPIWEKLWLANPERTKRAIEGLRYHFDGPYTQTFIFNRLASWQKLTASIEGYNGLGIEQYQYGWSAPFISHAGLLSYSFMFLYTKTKNPEWLKWSRGVGSLHWNYRNKTTNLTSWDINSRRLSGPQFGQTASMAYYLYKTYELNRKESEMRKRSLIFFKAAEKYAWRGKEKFYVDDLNMDGTPLKADDPRFKRVPQIAGDQMKKFRVKPVFQGNIGRIAAYFYSREKDPHFLLVARRMIDIMERDSLPAIFFANNVADRIHLLMDVYEITKERKLLNLAKKYADLGISGLWREGLFARCVGDPFYESKDDVGNFVAGLLRIHLAEKSPAGVGKIDWSY